MRDDLRATIAQVRADGRSRNVRCPAHEDRRPSLSVSRGSDGRLLIHCFKGCDPKDIVAAIGLTMADLGAGASVQERYKGSPIIAIYSYVDERGALLYEVCRTLSKQFPARRPGSNGSGSSIWNLHGVRKVLYRLDRLQEERRVFLCEGEKDAEALECLGLVATTSPGGASENSRRPKWIPDYAEQLYRGGAELVICLPDNDSAGRAHMAAASASCRARGIQTITIALPALATKGDVSDWIAAGGTRAALEDLVAVALASPSAPPADDGPRPIFALTMVELASYTFPPRRPILYRHQSPIIREGHIDQLFGARGIGKSLFGMTLAIVAATGTEALGFSAPNLCRVLYVDGEMDSEDIRARAAQLRVALNVCDSPNLTILAADWQDGILPRLDTEHGREIMRPFVDAAQFIILDNRSCLFDPEGEKDPVAWQAAQDWLLSLRRQRKAVLMIHHANRQGTSRGHSKAEDVLNLEMKLSRPEGYTADQGARFLVEFDKTRGVYGAAVAPFTVRLLLDGWHIEEEDGGDHVTRKLREYLRLADKLGERPKSANTSLSKAQLNRNLGLKAFAAMVASGEILGNKKEGYYLR